LLILKLTLVPLALLALGIVERLHGPRIAGWLAGFPVVAGPLLLFISLEHGAAFGSAAALGGYFGLAPWLAFTMTYATFARRHGWVLCALCGFAAWSIVALAAVAVQDWTRWLEIAPFAAFLAAIAYFPRGEASDEEREHIWWGVPLRMVAGAVLTIVITRFANTMGTHWSGIFATFPVMGSIIAISNHLQYGRHAVQEAVAGMTMGLASVGSFCFAAYLLLTRMEIGMALMLSLAISLMAHALTWLLFKKKPAKAIN
jgi:uncharacterized membrane protein (GlpM family)